MSAKIYQSNAIKTAVLGSSPLGLVVLTYEKLHEYLRETCALISRDMDAQEASEKAIDLIEFGLVAALDREKGGEIASNLYDLYQWGVKQILMARLNKDPQPVADVIRVFENLGSAWNELYDRQIQGENFATSSSVHLSTKAVETISTL